MTVRLLNEMQIVDDTPGCYIIIRVGTLLPARVNDHGDVVARYRDKEFTVYPREYEEVAEQ